MTFPAVLPHDPIEKIGDDVFMASGSVNINRIIRFSRNMAIVRRDQNLTLINPIRLSYSELARLDDLGHVKHIIRLGAFHGMDDPFYMDRYKPKFWCQEGGTTYTQPAIDQVLTETSDLPFDNAKLFCFKETLQPECMLLLPSEQNLLLTCDAIQHYADYSNSNLPARIMSPFIGFPKTTLIGPFWIKLMTPEGASLRGEFERLLELKFDRLLSAHGTLLEADAHSAVANALKKAYPS